MAGPFKHSVRRAPQRGFSLLELMTVVVMITIFAGISIPVLVQQMRERRVQEAAERVAGLYREARMRAMGRGSAVMVRYVPAARGGRFEVREAQRGSSAQDATCAALPVSSCLSPNWDGPADQDYRSISLLDLVNRGEYDRLTITMNDARGSLVQNLDVCFTPLGRTFGRTSATQPLTPLNAVHVAEVFRGTTESRVGRTRRVVILPNGTSRIN